MNIEHSLPLIVYESILCITLSNDLLIVYNRDCDKWNSHLMKGDRLDENL